MGEPACGSLAEEQESIYSTDDKAGLGVKIEVGKKSAINRSPITGDRGP
jgi:hypothetical protein